MQSIISDSFNVTTLLGSHLGLSSLLPVPFDQHRETTLNNYLNIFPNEQLPSMPKLRYYGVGIKGCYNADDEILSSAYNPDRVNMNLFQLIPLRCRPIDEDLSDAERAYYRLRQRKVINGAEYFLYYLKVMDFDNQIKFKRINPLTGEEEPYELNPEYLEPKPVKPNTNTTIESTAASIVSYCNARVVVEASEVLEYIRTAHNGDSRYARISEIGFFTGVDIDVNGTTGQQGIPIQYKEAIYTQLHTQRTWLGAMLTHEGMKIDSEFEFSSYGSISEK